MVKELINFPLLIHKLICVHIIYFKLAFQQIYHPEVVFHTGNNLLKFPVWDSVEFISSEQLRMQDFLIRF